MFKKYSDDGEWQVNVLFVLKEEVDCVLCTLVVGIQLFILCPPPWQQIVTNKYDVITI